MFRRIPIAGFVSLIAIATTASAQQATLSRQSVELERPAELQVQAPADSTILKARSTEALLRQRPVQKRMTIQSVRAQPVIQLKQGTADMRPVLQNPASPINVAQRLRTAPQLATVQADTFEVAEIPEGIVVRQFLAYQLQPGACTDPGKRRTVESKGVECFTRKTDSQRKAGFADSADQARYVADPAARSRAIAASDRAVAEQQAEIDSDIAQLRQSLSGPGRAQIVAEVGEAEANRLAALTDEQLQAEMLGRAEVAIEEVMFVPNLEAQDLRIKAQPTFGKAVRPPRADFELVKAAIDRDAIDARVLAAGGVGAESSPPAPSRPTDLRTVPTRPQGMTDFQANPALDITQDIAIDREIYLTGFTLGRSHEWRRRVSITVAWCLLGCKRTYYVEPYAGFGYGFGLRLPLQMDGTWRYSHQNRQEKAYFIPEFKPINANTQQYAAAGLPSAQRFDGQELVAEAQAYAGVVYKLTGNWQGNIGVDVGVDLTDRLPDPFRNGQFTPPMPGQTTPPVTRTIDQVDLLLGRAQFGPVGAKVHPAIKMELFSEGLQFSLSDHVANKRTPMNQSGKAYAVAVNDNHYSRFTVSDPVYNLGFQMTPGLVGRVYVDIAVWSHHWDWPVWFPQLKVQLPPNGVDFTCHAGTTCGHQYKLRADHWRPAPRANATTRPARTNPPTRTNPPARATPDVQPQRVSPTRVPARTTPD